LKIAVISLLALAWAWQAPLAHAQPASSDASAEPSTADAADTDDEGNPQPMMGVELDDQAARGHFQVAQALFQTGRYVEAGAEFEQAFELSHRAEMLFNAFVAYRDGAELERAAGALSHFLEVAPEGESTLSLRARLIRMQGRIAEQARVETEREQAVAAQAEAERERQQAEQERQQAEQRAEAERQRADGRRRQAPRRDAGGWSR